MTLQTSFNEIEKYYNVIKNWKSYDMFGTINVSLVLQIGSKSILIMDDYNRILFEVL